MKVANDYVKQKNLDRFFKEVIDFVKTSNSATEQSLRDEIDAAKQELKYEIKAVRDELKNDINEVRVDLKKFEEKTTREIGEIKQDIHEIKKITQDIRSDIDEIKEMNKHILAMIRFHEDRLTALNKKSHEHPADML